MNKQKKPAQDVRMPTGVRNLDAILCGGLPERSVSVIGGSPGSGKSTLVGQICFHNASPQRKALIFQTLSEPTAKTLRYLQQYSFFDRKKLNDGSVEFVDLGNIMRMKGLELASAKILEHMKRVRPKIVVIDSFKVFSDLAGDRQELRKFAYEIAINLMAWECTGFLLGEFTRTELQENPLSSIVDGIILMMAKEVFSEQRRFIQVAKMRGTDHARDEFPFVLNSDGAEIYAPRITLKRTDNKETREQRKMTGIANLDKLLGSGIQVGSTILISGVSGTGKTLLTLEMIYRGAKELNEKGIFFSFEETDARLITAARGMGWDLEKEIKRGKIEIVSIPQSDIMLERDLLIINDCIIKLKAKRVAIDSVSVFMNKVADSVVAREKMYQLATIVQRAGAIGFFTTDIPYGSRRISKFGVEETVVDGIILLTSTEHGSKRERSLEIYKLRNTGHVDHRHTMCIGKGGITIFRRVPKNTKIVKEESV